MDPVTIAIATMAAVGGLLKGFMSFSEGSAVKAQMQHRADQANQEAGVRAQTQLDQLDRTGGDAAVAAAASGGGLSGSSQEVIGDLYRRGSFNVRSSIYSGLVAAHNARYQGDVAYKQGILGGISDVLQGATQAAGAVAGASGPSGSLARQAGSAGRLPLGYSDQPAYG